MKHKAKFIKGRKSYKKVTNRKGFEDALRESVRISNLIKFYKELNFIKKDRLLPIMVTDAFIENQKRYYNAIKYFK